MLNCRDVDSHHDQSESVIDDQEKNNIWKVKVLFIITKRSIDESESVIYDYEKINMMKLKVLLKITRSSI